MLFAHLRQERTRKEILERLFGEILDVVIFGDDKSFALFIGTIDSAVNFQDDRARLEKMIGILVGGAFDALRGLPWFFVPKPRWIVAGVVEDEIVLAVTDGPLDEIVVIRRDIEREFILSMVRIRSGKMSQEVVDAGGGVGSNENGPKPLVERPFVELHYAVLGDAGQIQIGLKSLVAAFCALL